ncbi:hypothetical protein U0070_005764 [Myodes glareolus]|uniref:Ig-like domain-containing protein n=1 Tax=Myodes glareolus TaxID=447135 RepID=A0AAW0H7I6_MYOGA
MGTEVIQNPRYLVKGKEQKAKMDCTRIKGHSYVFWYYKKLGEELKFLAYFQNADIVDKIDTIGKNISAKCPTDLPCTIEIQSSQLTDSAVYFCASSQSTESKKKQKASRIHQSATMNMRFLCCVAICLLGAGSLDGQVIQTPKHLLKGKGQKAKMSCTPQNGHTYVYWYQQKQNKELRFLIYFQRQEVRERIDFVKERFVAECPINSPCSLEIQFSEAGDSALYLCASSFVDAAVTQTPRHLVKMKGQKATMKCSPEKGHTAVYWYQQKQDKELKFLIYFQNKQPLDQIDMVKERFSVEFHSDTECKLEIKSSEAGDSALYLCASRSFDAKVTQIPRHLVKEKGQKANMVCYPEKGHTAFYWYQQSQKEFKLLINFRNEEIIEQTDLVKKRFSAKCPSNSPCSLEIQSSEAGDAGLYFCASNFKSPGQEKRTECEDEKGHINQQDQNKEFPFLMYLENQRILQQTDMFSSLDVSIVQTPTHLVQRKGQKSKMSFSPAKRHTAVYCTNKDRAKKRKQLKLFSFRVNKFWNKQTLSRSDSPLNVPQTHPADWKSSPQMQETTMAPRLLCYTALCLLGAGLLNAKVIQTPRYLAKGKEQKAKMSCRPEKGHAVVFWYKQNNNNEFTFLISFQNQDVLQQIDMVKNRFSAECPSNSPCSLEIQSSEAGDSALYLCASSLSTALKCAFHSAHKPSKKPTQEAGVALG